MSFLHSPSLYIIAECAQGYSAPTSSESINLATWLVKSAKSAGADAVKFQLVIADELATPDYKYYELFKSLELTYDDWSVVASCAQELDIDLIFDIFGYDSLSIASRLGAKSIKLHPTDFNNVDLLNAVVESRSFVNVIAGCGGSSRSEILSTLNILKPIDSVTILHGFQAYPTLTQDNCLNRLRQYCDLASKFKNYVRLGFADHADPLSAESHNLACMSLGFGVSVIEKHLTLARCLRLEDYESALSPDEFKSFVDQLRSSYSAIGSATSTVEEFEFPESELNYRTVISRHVVSSRSLQPGHIVSAGDFLLKRSSSSSAINDPSKVMGRKLSSMISKNHPFELNDFVND